MWEDLSGWNSCSTLHDALWHPLIPSGIWTYESFTLSAIWRTLYHRCISQLSDNPLLFLGFGMEWTVWGRRNGHCTVTRLVANWYAIGLTLGSMWCDYRFHCIYVTSFHKTLCETDVDCWSWQNRRGLWQGWRVQVWQASGCNGDGMGVVARVLWRCTKITSGEASWNPGIWRRCDFVHCCIA